MSIEKSVGDLGQPVTGPSPASASARRQQLAASTYKHSQTATVAWLTIKTKTERKQGFLGSTRSKYYQHCGKHEILLSARLCMLNERRSSQFRRVIDDYQQKSITKIEFTEWKHSCCGVHIKSWTKKIGRKVGFWRNAKKKYWHIFQAKMQEEGRWLPGHARRNRVACKSNAQNWRCAYQDLVDKVGWNSLSANMEDQSQSTCSTDDKTVRFELRSFDCYLCELQLQT